MPRLAELVQILGRNYVQASAANQIGSMTKPLHPLDLAKRPVDRVAIPAGTEKLTRPLERGDIDVDSCAVNVYCHETYLRAIRCLQPASII